MTEFEMIKNALGRVRADLNIYNFGNLGKSIYIPVNTLLAPDGIDLELEFNGEGKLINVSTWG